ncbi:MAG: amidase [Alphaproteobacteria bacterium]|nr:amidase [Alphaproteobacteria bacterium]
MALTELSAVEAADGIARGEIRSVELVEACLQTVAEREPAVHAWAHIDADHALAQAKAADEARAAGAPCGSLHGVPVALKDIFDTADMPTEFGTPLFDGRMPERDSAVAERLREAGAVILGKAVTAELATFTPGPTANPHDPKRTPGGSSSGSAAAVAANMAPLALGSQTVGSTIRPAAFCGVFGYKPSYGRISRRGMLPLSNTFDTVGLFARTLPDIALLADVLDRYDGDDPAMRLQAPLRLSEAVAEAPPVPPTVAFVKTAAWHKAEPATVAGFEELVEALGDSCDTVDLPEPFAAVADLHNTVLTAEMAKSVGSLCEEPGEHPSARFREMVEDGRKVSAADYLAAREHRDVLNAGLNEVFDRYDAIITPAAPGEAPEGLDATGDPSFCTLWTFCGVPALSLPLLVGEHGLPVGVQIVGQRGHDRRLMRNARWLMGQLADEGETP